MTTKQTDKPQQGLTSQGPPPASQTQAVGPVQQRTILENVTERVTVLTDRQELHLPANYSAANALREAWLILQQTENKDHQPVLTACTRESIQNCLFEMVILGLNPAKKQCYFIARGKALTLYRSYFGSMMLTKDLANASDVWAEVIYEGDEFEYAILGNRRSVMKHVQKLANIGKALVGAYCVIEFSDRPSYTEIMTIDQIHKSWEKSQTGGKVHAEFPDQMAKRTVIARACKYLINSTRDDNLRIQVARKVEEIADENDLQEEIAQNANRTPIDISAAKEVPAVMVGDENAGKPVEEEPPF